MSTVKGHKTKLNLTLNTCSHEDASILVCVRTAKIEGYSTNGSVDIQEWDDAVLFYENYAKIPSQVLFKACFIIDVHSGGNL